MKPQLSMGVATSCNHPLIILSPPCYLATWRKAPSDHQLGNIVRFSLHLFAGQCTAALLSTLPVRHANDGRAGQLLSTSHTDLRSLATACSGLEHTQPCSLPRRDRFTRLVLRTAAMASVFHRQMQRARNDAAHHVVRAVRKLRPATHASVLEVDAQFADDFSSKLNAKDARAVASAGAAARVPAHTSLAVEDDFHTRVPRGFIHPLSWQKLAWDLLVSLLIVYSALVVPLRICFDIDTNATVRVCWQAGGRVLGRANFFACSPK